MIRPGEQIPDVRMEAYHRGEAEHVTLRERRGRWLLLLFYPSDFTFICPTELAAFAQLEDQFEETGAELISVGTDTVFTHQRCSGSSV